MAGVDIDVWRDEEKEGNVLVFGFRGTGVWVEVDVVEGVVERGLWSLSWREEGGLDVFPGEKIFHVREVDDVGGFVECGLLVVADDVDVCAVFEEEALDGNVIVAGGAVESCSAEAVVCVGWGAGG